LRLTWAEAGGPHVAAPVQRGFGSRLIERSARDQLGGDATVDFLPRGVVYTVNCLLDPASGPDAGGELRDPTAGPMPAG
jgi:two-component sensor histidine kinase